MENFLKKYAKVIFEPIKYSPKNFIVFFIMEIFFSSESVFVVVLMSYVVKALEDGNTDKLYFWIGIYIAITIIKFTFAIFSDALYGNLYSDIKSGLSCKYLKEYINLDNTMVETYGTGKMVNIISKGKNGIFNILRLSIDIFVELFAIIYIFIIVSTRLPNIYYFIIFFLFFILIISLMGIGLSKLTKIRKKVKEINIKTDGQKTKILMSKFEIFQNGKINSELLEIKKLYSESKKLWWKGNLNKSLWETGANFILRFNYIVLFLVIGKGVISGNYDIATFALLVWILQILGKYAWQIRSYLRDIITNFIDVEKLVDVFDEIPKYKDSSNLPNFVFNKGDVKFENISFGYNEKTKIFDNFNLELVGGKKYAFVGESGGGKSTLIKLLAGYINPNKGNIIIDNQKISEVNLKTYYKNIGYLSQDPSVFDGSILENLLYALDYIPEDSKINEIIKLSKCEFIYELPNNIKTQIGEKGIKLSGGQKQRLAIAKIMLKDPKIILLDEPTSALDSFNEEQVTAALKVLFKNKTVIVIAHRLQTVKNSDIIFYVENGKIIERGNHKELLKQKGGYYKMIELQSGF